MSRKPNIETKLMLFHTFILCHFNFCPLVWHFCSFEGLKKIEKLQHGALKFVFNDFISSYSELRAKASRPLMVVQRQRLLLTEVFKILNKFVPKYNHDMFVRSDNSYLMRNKMALVQPVCKSVKYGLNSFRYQGAKLWNTIHCDVKCDASLNDFKSYINAWKGTNCTCSYCNMCVLKRM